MKKFLNKIITPKVLGLSVAAFVTGYSFFATADNLLTFCSQYFAGATTAVALLWLADSDN